MSTTGKFSCDGCGKQYTWKAELAGRRVKCKCGHALTVPNEDPAALADAPDGFEDLYALAEDSGPSKQKVQQAPAYVRAAAPAMAMAGAGAAAIPQGAGGGGAGAAAGVLGYASMAPKRRDDDGKAAGNPFWNPVTDLYVPAGLILLGFVLSLIEMRWVIGIRSIPIAVIAVGVLTMINLAIGFAGILITAKVMDLGLGPLPVAIMKTAAASILPAAVASLIAQSFFGGALLGLVVSYVLSVTMFIKLMDMDYFEGFLCAAIVWIVGKWVGMAILAMIFSGMMSAGGGGGGFAGGGGGGGGGGRSPGGGLFASSGGGASSLADDGDDEGSAKKSPGAKYDDRAEELLSGTHKADAKEWVEKGNNAFSGRTHDQSRRIVATLLSMGGQFMVVVEPVKKGEEKEVGPVLVFLLPTDKPSRKKIFDFYPSLGKTYGISGPKDEGQGYMSVEFVDEDAEEHP